MTTGIVVGAALTGSVATAYADDITMVRNSPIMADRQRPPGPARAPGKSPKKAVAAAIPTKVTAQALIALAKKQVGVSSGTKYQDWYMSTPRAAQTVARDGGSISGYAGAEWCDMFVSWLGSHVGIARTMGEDPWTVAHAQWFKSQKRWGHTPRPGSVVFFSWSGGTAIDSINHVGIVVRDNKDGTIQTIEGNTGGGQVLAKQRDTSQVVGYGYPVYAAKPSPARTPVRSRPWTRWTPLGRP